jgi:hypothetical protein
VKLGSLPVAVISILIFSGLSGFAALQADAWVSDSPDESRNDAVIGWDGTVHATQYNDEGEVIYRHRGENLLTKEGANFIRSHLVGDTNNPINYVALSNASSFETNVEHSFLQGEVTSVNMSRIKGNVTKLDDTGTWQIKATWIANGSINGVKATGLFPHDVQGSGTSDNANILVAEETMASKAFRDGYRFEVTWVIEQQTG